MTINENIYHINYSTLIKMLLPGFLRKPKLLAFLAALTTPLVVAYEQFREFREDAVYRVSHNGSIVMLTKMLNDKFDPVERRIFIKNIQQQAPTRFYSEAANKEVGFYSEPNQKRAFRSSLFLNPDAADFTIYVPQALQPMSTELSENLLTRMRGQVDYYKLFAKKYTIIWTT